MKSRWLIALAAVAALVPVSSFAQSTRLRVTVPFEFRAGRTVLPAGDYQVQDIASMGNGTVRIRTGDLSSQAYVFAHLALRDSELDKSILVFNRYGNTHFLSKVWWAGSTVGVELSRAKAETELAKTAGLRRPEQVTLMASR